MGVASVVSFIKREFNDAGYCDEGEGGLGDNDVGGEDNGCSKCNGTVCGPAKLRSSELPRGANADGVLADGRYGYGYGWQVRIRVTGAGWRVAGNGRQVECAEDGQQVAGGW